jgi:hypothetical protein
MDQRIEGKDESENLMLEKEYLDRLEYEEMQIESSLQESREQEKLRNQFSKFVGSCDKKGGEGNDVIPKAET